MSESEVHEEKWVGTTSTPKRSTEGAGPALAGTTQTKRTVHVAGVLDQQKMTALKMALVELTKMPAKIPPVRTQYALLKDLAIYTDL